MKKIPLHMLAIAASAVLLVLSLYLLLFTDHWAFAAWYTAVGLVMALAASRLLKIEKKRRAMAGERCSACGSARPIAPFIRQDEADTPGHIDVPPARQYRPRPRNWRE